MFMSAANKIDVPSEHWDKLFAPSACLVMITTVDENGGINAASYGTCVRVCHDPLYIAFTTGATKDTYNNILANCEFVVNVPLSGRFLKVRVVGLEFPPRERAETGLTGIPSGRYSRHASPSAAATLSAQSNGPSSGCIV
jgi:flavin reductase (DIM6/NTAB) family NADH-FMN oxidoreductase RutF